MFRIKTMAAAVLLAASGIASAQMALPVTGNGSLMFVAYDPVSLTTYSFNTSRLFQSFLPGAPVTDPGRTFSFTLPSWSSFLATPGLDAPSVRWGVFASDGFAPTGLMTTATAPGAINGLSRLNTINSVVGSFTNAHNSLGTHPGSTSGWAIHRSTAAAAPTDGAYGGFLFGLDNNWNRNATFTVVGAIGQSLGFHLFTGSNIGVNQCTSLACTRHAYANPFGNANWNLTTDGALVYTAPVPEASTLAMMAAGLLTLGFVARRRIGK